MNIRDFIKRHPGKSLYMMTPGGYVYLTPENAKALLDGKSATGHDGDPKMKVEISAEELLEQPVLSAHNAKDAWRLLTGYPHEQAPQSEEVDRLFEMETELRDRLARNHEEYMQQLQCKSTTDLIKLAPEITASETVYNAMMDSSYPPEQVEYLLRFANPLEVVRDKWIEEQYRPDISEEMSHVLWNLADKQDADQHYELHTKENGPDSGMHMT